VYLHGSGGTESGADQIAEKLGGRHRFCAYDRPNASGISEPVDGPLTGKNAVAELHALLAAGDVPGPYVLLGASRGGLLADMYASSYPDDVAGMVLLDVLLPNDLISEFRYVPKAHRELKPNIWKQDPEQYDLLTTFRQARALQGNEPNIPVTYIGTKRIEFLRSWPRKEISAELRKNQREFVARFSPGRLIIVDTPHYMEPVQGRPTRAADSPAPKTRSPKPRSEPWIGPECRNHAKRALSTRRRRDSRADSAPSSLRIASARSPLPSQRNPTVVCERVQGVIVAT
jgi:pimeloyl-ACP methyl ester carboxylesterase